MKKIDLFPSRFFNILEQKIRIRFNADFLNTDYNLDTPTKSVQKAVHTETLILYKQLQFIKIVLSYILLPMLYNLIATPTKGTSLSTLSSPAQVSSVNSIASLANSALSSSIELLNYSTKQLLFSVRLCF